MILHWWKIRWINYVGWCRSWSGCLCWTWRVHVSRITTRHAESVSAKMENDRSKFSCFKALFSHVENSGQKKIRWNVQVVREEMFLLISGSVAKKPANIKLLYVFCIKNFEHKQILWGWSIKRAIYNTSSNRNEYEGLKMFSEELRTWIDIVYLINPPVF